MLTEIKEKRWKLENENDSVKKYLDTLKIYRQAINEATKAAEFGKFSPEAMRFAIRKHNEITDKISMLEQVFEEKEQVENPRPF